MKSDINGCSTCQPGQESYEVFYTKFGSKIQYDYRLAVNGELFTCVALDVETARRRRDVWLFDKGITL